MAAEKCPQCGAWWAWPSEHRCPPTISTNSTRIHFPEPPAPRPISGALFPRVQGRCPSCGGRSLFLGAGGYVTCSRLECSDPCAPTDLLAGDPL